jgi:hypothetical protein
MANAPTQTTKDILTEVIKADPYYHGAPVVYEFSNGRKFLCDDDSENGIYRKD